MGTIELQLDQQTLQRVKQLAASRGVSPEKLIEDLLSGVEAPRERGGSLIGLFRDDAALLDQVVEWALEARKRDRFRSDSG